MTDTLHLEAFRRWSPISLPITGPVGQGWARYVDDMAYSFATRGASFVVHIWGRKGRDFFLLHQRHGVTAALAEESVALVLRFPSVHTKLVPPSLVPSLQRHLLGLQAVEPSPSSVAGAVLLARSGHVHVPKVLDVWTEESGDAAVMALSWMKRTQG